MHELGINYYFVLHNKKTDSFHTLSHFGTESFYNGLDFKLIVKTQSEVIQFNITNNHGILTCKTENEDWEITKINDQHVTMHTKNTIHNTQEWIQLL